MEENIEKDIKIGDIVELKSKHIGTIININEFREPSMKYGIDIKGFNDIAFVGEEAILRKIEKQNNIDEDIEILKNPQKMELTQLIRTFKREGIKNFVTVRKEALENVLSELKENKKILKCTQDSWYKDTQELEKYKKITENLANTLSKEIYNKLGIKPRIEDLIEVARKEVENE